MNPLQSVEDKYAGFIVFLAVATLAGDQLRWIEEDDTWLKITLSPRRVACGR